MDSASSGRFWGDPMNDRANFVRLTPEEQKRRRKRSLALAVTLALFCILLFAATMAKLGPGVLQRPL